MTTADHGAQVSAIGDALLDVARRWPGRFVRAGHRAVVRLISGDDFTYASSIAYYALVSLFPFLLVTASVIGRLTDDPSEQAAVSAFVLRFFPAQMQLVRTQLEAVSSASLGLGLAGTAVAAWVSLGIFRAITTAINRAWEVERAPSFLRNQIIAFTMLIGAGALLVLALAWISLGGIVRSSGFVSALEALPGLAMVVGLPIRYAGMGAVMVVAAFVFTFVPHTYVRLRDVWVGALLTALLWQAGLAGFSWYLRDVADLSLHGSIATVVTFLFWVYTSAVIFLFGAEFTASWIREQQAEG